MTRRLHHASPWTGKRPDPAPTPERPQATPTTYACRQASALLHQAHTRLYDPGLYPYDRPGDQKHIDHAFALAVETALKLAPFVSNMQPIPNVSRNAEDIKNIMARLIDLAGGPHS